MRTQFIRAPGQDFVSISLPAGECRGVTIDNPSGSWLQLYPTYDWIAPYTIGWATPLQNAAASVTIKALPTGPAGQLSSTDGDDVVVYLDSVPVPASAGVTDQFVNRSKQPEIDSDRTGQPADLNPASVQLPTAALNGQRVRIFRVDMHYPDLPTVDKLYAVTGFVAFVGGSAFLATLNINPNKPHDFYQPALPVDGPLNVKVDLFYRIYTMRNVPAVITQDVEFELVYGLI